MILPDGDWQVYGLDGGMGGSKWLKSWKVDKVYKLINFSTYQHINLSTHNISTNSISKISSCPAKK